MTSVLLTVSLLFCMTPLVFGKRILFLLPIASKSHVHVFEPLARALALRDHDIVVVSPAKMSDMPSDKVTQVHILSTEEIFDNVGNFFEQRKLGLLRSILNGSMSSLIPKCGKVLRSPQFQALITNETFDLVIIDILMSYCAAGAIPILKAPSILVTCYPAPPLVTNEFGNRFLPSFVVDPMKYFPHQMDFSQRVVNTLFGAAMYLGGLYGFAYPSEKEYRKYLPDGENLPGIISIQRNASLIFSNSHWSINHPRPLLPDVIEVGGMHTRPPKPLQKDLAEWLNESSDEDGFIFFSLGSIVKGNSMPEEIRKTFVRVFAKLRHRVLWKWENDTMEDLKATNILLRKWLPQQDILGHKKIKLFMSHGGLLSTQEAVYHGVPMLAIPILGDQDLNAKRVEAAGFAKSIEILTMTDESLENAIQEMVDNPTYSQRAREISRLFRDVQNTPLETALFYTEYVIRFQGASHLRSYARDLNFFQYYILDVLLFLFLILMVVLFMLYTCCKWGYLRCRGKSNSDFKGKVE